MRVTATPLVIERCKRQVFKRLEIESGKVYGDHWDGFDAGCNLVFALFHREYDLG